MAKKHRETKDKNKNLKLKLKLKQAAPQADASGGSYADGTPLDRVQYLEAKLILKPDRFTSVQSLPRLRQDRAAYGEEGWCWFHRGP